MSSTSAGVDHGVNGMKEGRVSIPCSRSRSMASTASSVVWPLSKRARISSLTHSSALTTNRQPEAANSSHTSACSSTCSTLVVQSKVSVGKRS